jgi:hypothetical protein
MSTIKLIIAGIGSALGLAFLIFVGVMAYQIKNSISDARTKKDIADSVRIQGQLDDLTARVHARDLEAARTNTVFIRDRAAAAANPVVTGGGPKADSIANAAVHACYESATNALTACQKARVTADSVPMLKDSINAISKRLADREHPRWTAKGFIGEAFPMRKPMIAVSSDFKVPLLPLNATAGADYLIMGAPNTPLDSALAKQKWRAYLGASIPFR